MTGLLGGRSPEARVTAPMLAPMSQWGMYRQPYVSESAFFAANPHVAGMAAADDRVILNPRAGLDEVGKKAVFDNERTRILLRHFPMFDGVRLSPEQERKFARYGGPVDRIHTVLARLLSGDPSAGEPTFLQSNAVQRIRGLLDPM